MDISKKVALKADVEMFMDPEGKLDYVAFKVYSRDQAELTGQQILEAVSEAVIINWPNCPLESWDDHTFDA